METTTDEFSELMSEREVAAWLGVEPSVVKSMRRYESGPAFLKFGRTVRYRPDDVYRWAVETGRVPAYLLCDQCGQEWSEDGPSLRLYLPFLLHAPIPETVS